jgi:phenylpropionate dioxygenase-like ring-hydroxylating dioxygenase large terminal subunit
MLSVQDNETICRVGPSTPMGNLMRQYWLPAFMSSELPAPDCPPLRVLLLGERLIAFRDSEGRPGLVVEACPHRGASLFFGRNEDSGLRCVYHGWKFDVTGACVDMPSEPAESNFRTKVRVRAYPTRERCGMVWAYMGPRQTPPPLPDLEGNMQPEGGWSVNAMQSECNWLQVLEGDIDTVHFGFLHRGSVDPWNLPPWSGPLDRYAVQDRAPRYEVVDIDGGAMYGAYRPAEADTYYWRIALFLFPFYSMPPGGGGGVLCRVPMDDEHTMSFTMSPRRRAQNRGAGGGVPVEAAAADPAYARLKSPMLPNTSAWYGRFRPGSNLGNDFEIDRGLQRANRGNNGYTGIVGNIQDLAITHSMGTIYDRSREHLATSDSMIIRTRRRLLAAARALAEDGTVPPGVDEPEVYAVRSAAAVLPRGADWIEASAEARRAFPERPLEAAPTLGA